MVACDWARYDGVSNPPGAVIVGLSTYVKPRQAGSTVRIGNRSIRMLVAYLWFVGCHGLVTAQSAETDIPRPSTAGLAVASQSHSTSVAAKEKWSRNSKPSPKSDGNLLLQQAIARLKSYQSIRCSVRQRIELFGHTLVGTGEYQQLNQGTDLLLRSDLKIQLEDRAATYQQICDGRFLWRYHNSPDVDKLGAFRQELSRVDLDVVRRHRSLDYVPLDAAPGYGGLSQLLEQIHRHFEFQPPQPGMLHEVPVWMLPGTVQLATFDQFPGNQVTAQRSPEHFPHFVTLALGQEDLFPFRIEYRRKKSDGSSSEIVVTADSRAIVTLELFQVQLNLPLNPELFVKRAGDMPVRDATQSYLEQMGVKQ